MPNKLVVNINFYYFLHLNYKIAVLIIVDDV